MRQSVAECCSPLFSSCHCVLRVLFSGNLDSRVPNHIWQGIVVSTYCRKAVRTHPQTPCDLVLSVRAIYSWFTRFGSVLIWTIKSWPRCKLLRASVFLHCDYGRDYKLWSKLCVRLGRIGELRNPLERADLAARCGASAQLTLHCIKAIDQYCIKVINQCY